MRTRWHAASAALGGLGALVVHQLAYLGAYPATAARARALGQHDHLALQWRLVTPLAVVAGVGLVLHQLRLLLAARPGAGAETGAPGFPTVTGRRLTVITAALFVAQESIEALAGRHGAPAPWANPAVLLGLVLTPLVAVAMARFLNRVTRAAVRWLRRTVRSTVTGADPVGPPPTWAAPGRTPLGPSPRGPPGFVVP